jgi:hypothetical protein
MKITITGRQIAIALVVIAVAYLLRQHFTASASMSVGSGGNAWTVYGTMQCGWTRKQLDYMKSKKIAHTFVDCANGACKGKTAFPTLVSPEGEELVGYNEI